MTDIIIRRDGRAGRITLNRPAALNALTDGMVRALDAALIDWLRDDAVDLIVIDAAGERAFCAGGDIAELYAQGRAGNFGHGQAFWRREYRMNARIAEYPKPVVSLMQGFTMGGGVGVGCHATHRIAGESSRIAMPECGIGLVPDVGGCFLLALAPGRMGEYLGTTGARMAAGDAIDAGFADWFVPEAGWPDLIAALCATGDATAIETVACPAPPGTLCADRAEIETHFAGETLGDIWRSLAASDSPFAVATRQALRRVSPLAAACTIEMLHRLGDAPTLRRALELEYRFTHRSQEHSDFLEGIRAAVIDKDRSPRWRHAGPDTVTGLEVARMLMPLGKDMMRFEEDVA
ncbi:MAG: enoyl-CoA hydratase/isomerase family protein [Paracoccaceae bacterium]|nr:MAG: enoyl-CoA hydratase/isomerase family protein [Paracoccaceae bacterium]